MAPALSPQPVPIACPSPCTHSLSPHSSPVPVAPATSPQPVLIPVAAQPVPTGCPHPRPHGSVRLSPQPVPVPMACPCPHGSVPVPMALSVSPQRVPDGRCHPPPRPRVPSLAPPPLAPPPLTSFRGSGQPRWKPYLSAGGAWPRRRAPPIAAQSGRGRGLGAFLPRQPGGAEGAEVGARRRCGAGGPGGSRLQGALRGRGALLGPGAAGRRQGIPVGARREPPRRGPCGCPTGTGSV